jgi:hypothetical protein
MPTAFLCGAPAASNSQASAVVAPQPQRDEAVAATAARGVSADHLGLPLWVGYGAGGAGGSAASAASTAGCTAACVASSSVI